MLVYVFKADRFDRKKDKLQIRMSIDGGPASGEITFWRTVLVGGAKLTLSQG